MTDIPLFTGLEPNPDDEARAALARERAKKLANSLASAPVAAVMPDRQLPGPLGYIPFAGTLEALGGFAGQAIGAVNDVSNWIDDKIGLPIKPRLPTGNPEFLDKAGEHFETTRKNAQQVIAEHTPLTMPDPNDPVDQAIDRVGATLGMAIPHTPSFVAKVITGLAPNIVKPLLNLVLATPEGFKTNAKIAGGMAGYNEGAQALENYIEPPDAPTPTPPQTPPAPTKVAANMTPGTASDARVDLGLNAALQASAPAQVAPPAPPRVDLGLNAALAGGDQPVAPRMDATGYSSHTMLHAGLTLGAVMFGLGAARLMHGTTRVITDAERAARFNDPEYAAKVADYNNSRIARGGSNVSAGLDPVAPPPLPEQGKVRQGMNYLNNQVLNEHAQMQDIIRMQSNPTEAESLAHMYGNTHDNAYFNTKMEQFLETGRHAETGVRTEPLAPLYREIHGLGPDQKLTLMEGLGAANEQDNRRINGRAAAQSTAPTTTNDLRHDFWNQSDADLAAAHTRMLQDPVTRDLAERFWRANQGTTEIGERLGFFTKDERKRLDTERPHYVPETGVDGKTMHPFGARDLSRATGVEQMTQEPWRAQAQHIEELHKQYSLNTMNQQIERSTKESFRSNPGAAQYMYDVGTPTKNPSFYEGGTFRDSIVGIRTPSGTKYVRVDHPDVYNAMTGESLAKRRAALGVLGHMRNWTTYWTTGPGSLVTGRLAGPINATYSALVAGTNLPKNMYAGALDRVVQRATGHTSSIARGIDTVTTTVPGIVGSYARGVADRAYNRFGMGDRLANLISQGNRNPINDTLRAHLGHANVDALERSLREYYYNTDTFKMEADLGLGGQGIPVKSDVSSLTMKGDKETRLAIARLVPEMFQSPGAIPGLRPTTIRLNKIISDAMGHISDATHDYITRLNMDNPNISKQTLSYEIRNMVGSGGVHGANRYLRGATNILPFSNVSLQGGARLGRALLEQPGIALGSLATSFGTIALAELLTHMRSHAHMDYFNNTLSSQQQAGYIVLATNDDPSKPTMIKVPQEVEWAHALAKEVISKVLNIAGARHDGPWYKAVWDGVSDFLGSHISNTSMNAMEHAAIDAGDFVNLPQPAGHIDWYSMMHGKGLADSYRSPMPGTQSGSLPNQVPDGLFDDKMGRMTGALIKAAFGGLAVAYDTVNSASRYAKQYGSWLDGLGKAGHDWLQTAMDRNPSMNMLFEHQLRASQQSPIEEMVQPRIAALEKITGARTAGIEEGWTGRGRYAQPVPTSVDKKLPTDPTMLTMYNMASAYKTGVSSRVGEIKEIKRQMGAVQNLSADPVTNQPFTPEKRREWMNKRTRDVADKYRMVNAQLNDLDYMLSRVVGKPVHLEDIHFDQGPDQFR